MDNPNLLNMTVEIVKSQNFDTQTHNMETLIKGIYSALVYIHDKQVDVPKIPTIQSNTYMVEPDYIVCLEDNTKHVALKKYLKRKFGLTFEQYKAKWMLPDDYPSICPNYSKRRSEIAIETRLGKPKKKIIEPIEELLI